MCTEKDAQNKTLAGRFLKFDYVESKDLGKLFLTLVAAILAISVTFADKIVATPTGKSLLLVAQIVYFGSVMTCTVGLSLLYYAGRYAMHCPSKDTFRTLAKSATCMWIATAACFMVGNVFLLLAGRS